MTEDLLKFMGFKKKQHGGSYWFELVVEHHRFITCDNWYAKEKKKWIIGYENKKKKSEDMFWFNDSLDRSEKFARVFSVLTGYNHSLTGVYKKKIDWDKIYK